MNKTCILNFLNEFRELFDQSILENTILFENRERLQCDPFELNNSKFMRLFRLNKDMVQRIIDVIEEYSDPISRRSALDAEQKERKNYIYVYIYIYIYIYIYLFIYLFIEFTDK